MKHKLLASVILGMTATFATAAEGWMTDFSAAKEKAIKENKSLLVDFTGSDWCHWCIKLDEEVFAHEAFKKGVAEKFVLVELDFPRDKSKVSEATIKQNAELQKKYNVKGFPTILLMNANGTPFAKTGYQAGGPEKYVQSLDAFLKEGKAIDSSIAAAAKLEGLEKAKALTMTIDNIDESLLPYYQDITDQITALDPEDKLGTKARKAAEKAAEKAKEDKINKLFVNTSALGKEGKVKEAKALIDSFIADNTLDENIVAQIRGYQKTIKFMKLSNDVNLLSRAGKFDDAIKTVDTHVTEHNLTGEVKQVFLSMKMTPLFQAKKYDAVEALLKEIIAIDSESETGKSVEQMVPRVMAHIKKTKAAEMKAAEENKAK